MVKRLLGSLAGTALLTVTAIRLRLPDRVVEWFSRRVAGVAYRVIGSRRRVGLRNLERAFGRERSAADRARILRAAFDHTAIGFSEILTLFRGGRARLTSRVRVEGGEHLRDALAAGRGVIAVSGHYGVYPFLGAAFPASAAPFSFLYRKPNSPKAMKLFDDWLVIAGTGVIEDKPRHSAAVRCLRALARNEIVAILVDQHFSDGVDVPFFGVPVKTGVGAALLAARSGAALLPMFVRREPGGGYLMRIEPPLAAPADHSPEALTATTAAATARIEAWVREAPDQWFWVHRRFKELDRAGL